MYQFAPPSPVYPTELQHSPPQFARTSLAPNTFHGGKQVGFKFMYVTESGNALEGDMRHVCIVQYDSFSGGTVMVREAYLWSFAQDFMGFRKVT